MAFGKKKEKAPSFYLNKEENGTSYTGNVGEDCPALVKFSPTGKAILETMGQTFWANPKENKHGVYFTFVIDGHFWFGSEGVPKKAQGGKPPRPYFQLKQGGKAEDSEAWKAKQASAKPSLDDIPFDGGSGSAGIAAPIGQSAGVQIKAGTASSQMDGQKVAPGPRPPKPVGRGYKPQAQS